MKLVCRRAPAFDGPPIISPSRGVGCNSDVIADTTGEVAVTGISGAVADTNDAIGGTSGSVPDIYAAIRGTSEGVADTYDAVADTPDIFRSLANTTGRFADTI